MKLYKILCKLCGKPKEVEYPRQIFCSRQCSGKFNIKKRVYKHQNSVKAKLVKSDVQASRTYADTIDSSIVDQRYRPIKYPIDENQLFECIKNGDIISRPAMVKIVKTMQSYQKYLKKQA